MLAQSKEAILLEGNLKPPSRSYLDRVTHETRTHLRSRRWSLRLQKLQQKYPTKITLAPHLIILEFREWFHVDNGCFLQLFYHILLQIMSFSAIQRNFERPAQSKHRTRKRGSQCVIVKAYGLRIFVFSNKLTSKRLFICDAKILHWSIPRNKAAFGHEKDTRSRVHAT